jgi:hypothetical protein
VAREGGGINWGSVLGGAFAVGKALFGKSSPKPTLGDVISGNQWRPARPPGVAAPRVLGAPGSRPGVLQAQQTGRSSTTAPRDPAQDWLDAIQRGVQRGLELRQLLEVLLSLFRREPRAPGGFLEVMDVPYLISNPGGYGGGTDWLGGLTSLGASAAQIVQAMRGGGGAMPGGAFVPAAAGSVLTRVLGSTVGGAVIGAGASALLGGGGCAETEPYAPARGGARPRRHFKVNPETGDLNLFAPEGAILLTSRDVAGFRKVRRLGRKFGRRAGGR